MFLVSKLTGVFRTVAAKVAPIARLAWPYIKTGLKAAAEMALKEWFGEGKSKPKAA